METGSERVPLPGLHGHGAWVLPPARHIPYLIDGQDRYLLRWLSSVARRRAPSVVSKEVLDKVESGNGRIQGATFRRIDAKYRQAFTENQRGRLVELPRFSGQVQAWAEPSPERIVSRTGSARYSGSPSVADAGYTSLQ